MSATSQHAPNPSKSIIPLTPLRAQAPAAVTSHIDHERLMDCIHCGLCLSQCPTYAEDGLEADSPRGRIYLMRALAEGRSQATPSLVEHLDLCLGCRACETACPSGVQYGHLIEGTRAYLRENYKRPWKQRILGLAVESTFPYPARLEAMLLPVRILRRFGILPLLHRIGFMKLLGPLGDMEAMLPPLPPMRKRLMFAEQWSARGEKQARVGMITGCVMQVMQSPINEATARLLNKAGCEVQAPRDQACCGALHAHVGAMHEAKELAKKNIESFEKVERESGPLDAIVINAAGCGSALKEYAGWLQDDPEWADRARSFQDKVRDVSEWLAEDRFRSRLSVLMETRRQSRTGRRKSKADTAPKVATSFDVIDIPREVVPNVAGGASVGAKGASLGNAGANRIASLDANGALSLREATEGRRPHDPHDAPDKRDALFERTPIVEGRMTYHDACHLCHGQGIRTEPRDLLADAAKASDVEMVPLGESEFCCGSAGIYNITQPRMANQLLERKMKHIAKTGAGVVVTGNPGCAMQIRQGAGRYNLPIQVKHPVEVLDEATGR